MKRPVAPALLASFFAAMSLVLAPAAAFAESAPPPAPDAGGNASDVADDASATTADVVQETMVGDTGPSADVAAADEGSPKPDMSTPPDTTTTPDTGPTSFNENPCWDTKCAKETDACKASANCVKFKNCKTKDCQDAIQKADAAAVALFTAMQTCGFKSCNDPTKGTCKDQCGKFFGDKAPCNCDTACKQYNDCCQDYDALCGEPPPPPLCKDKCNSAIVKGAACQCDAGCATAKNCCSDYAAECAPACKPDCKDKKCGDDNGCDKKCSGNTVVCENGGKCDNSGTCVGGAKPAPDAGSETSTPVADAGSDTAVTGKDGGTVVAQPLPPPASSGCTGSSVPSSQGAWLAVVALFGVVVLRRRRTA